MAAQTYPAEKNKRTVKQFVIRLSLIFTPDFRCVTKNILNILSSLPRDDEPRLDYS